MDINLTLTKSSVGLGNVDNTSDLNKPISTLTQSALNLKLDASAYVQHFKGVHLTLAALQAAHPTGIAGDYAQVDTGAADPLDTYAYDLQDGWVLSNAVGSGAQNSDMLPEGSSNLYYTSARSNLKANLASPTFTGQVVIPLGTSAAPGVSFTGDSDTGLFGNGTGIFSVVNNATISLEFNATSLRFASGFSFTDRTTGNRFLRFISNNATGNDPNNNFFEITNGGTGVAPVLSVTGADTHIDLKLTPKGSGSVFVTGSIILTTNRLFLNNAAQDEKIAFARTGGNAYSLLHDATQFYLYNTTTSLPMWLVKNNGNVIINGSTDAGYKFDVIGTSKFTASVTAASALARAMYVNPTLTAAANNDVLVGLDIAPTFSTGAFTGVSSLALRVGGNIFPSATNSHALGSGSFIWNTAHINQVLLGIIRPLSSNIDFYTSNGVTNVGRIFTSTGNYLLQNGGTFTDGGERLQVIGTARFTTTLIASSALARAIYVNPILQATANNDVLVALDLSTTFVNGAFNGVRNYGIRVAATAKLAGIETGYVHKTTTDLLTGSDHFITAATAGGAFTLYLPDATTCAGREYVIVKTDASVNALTVETGLSQTINGTTTRTLTLQYAQLTVKSNGANWIITGQG